jgi:GMP synthase (glutamine-hydrolysing)
MILIVDFGSSKTPFIEDAVSKIHGCLSVGYYDFDEKTVEKYDGVIFSGAPILLTEVDQEPYLKTMDWVNNYNKPILGICFGHQLLGLLHGASVSMQREDRDLQWIEVIAHNPLFDDLDNPMEMQEDHCESISVPPGFVLSATSDATVNEAMHHKNKPFFGVQFHPEVSGRQGDQLLANFCKIVEIYKTQ